MMLKAVQNATHDFLNFYKYPADMPIAGRYDIPVIKGIKIKPDAKLKTVAFDEAHLIPTEQRKNYIIHFYIYDYKFERVWSFLNKNIAFLKQFKAVIAPDFSQYVDMPRAMCIWNAWRCNFMAWWWQNEGIKVIPNGHWSDNQSFTYSWDGMPKNSCIAICSKGCIVEDRRHSKQDTDIVATGSRFKQGIQAMVDNLHPAQIFWMGVKPEWLEDFARANNIEVITPTERKLYQERLDRRKQNGQ